MRKCCTRTFIQSICRWSSASSFIFDWLESWWCWYCASDSSVHLPQWRERGTWGERNCAAQLLLLPMGLSRCRWSPQVIINCFPYWAEIGLDNRWHFIARSCCCFFVTSLCNSERESFTGSRLPWKAQKKTRACDFLKQAFILSLFCTKCLASAILHLSETLVFVV